MQMFFFEISQVLKLKKAEFKAQNEKVFQVQNGHMQFNCFSNQLKLNIRSLGGEQITGKCRLNATQQFCDKRTGIIQPAAKSI